MDRLLVMMELVSYGFEIFVAVDCLDALDVPVGPCPHILYASFLSSLSSLVVSCQGSNSISIRLNANWSAQNIVEVGC